MFRKYPVSLMLVLGVFQGISITTPDNVEAASTTVVPGNTCQGQLGKSRPTGPAVEANLGADLIYCGLPRSNPTGTITSAFTRVQHPASGTTTCYFYAFDSLGNTFDWDSVSTSTAGDQSLSFTTADITTFAFGYYYGFCNVPQGTKIWGIRFSES